MPNKIGVYTPDDAREILLAVRQLKSAGLLTPGALESLIRGRPEFTEAPKQVINKSDEEIPPYACMEVIGTDFLENSIFLEVDKPSDSAIGTFLFNWHWPIDIDAKGVAQKHRILRAYTNGDAITAGDGWAPVVDDWKIAQVDGGIFRMCGKDEPQSTRLGFDVAKIEFAGVGNSGIQIYETPAGGIPARSGSTLGSATCTLVNVDDGTRALTSTTRTVYNDFLSDIAGDVDIFASIVDGIWCAHAEDCTDSGGAASVLPGATQHTTSASSYEAGLNGEGILFVDASANDVEVVLDTDNLVDIYIKVIAIGSGYTVTIEPAGADTIDGDTNKTITINNTAIRCVYYVTDTNWVIVT